MPLDTSIINVGEYYSSHYLDSTFARDVKELTDRWKDEGSQSPPRKFQNLAQNYFRAKTQALDEEKPARRSEAGEHRLQEHGFRRRDRKELNEKDTLVLVGSQASRLHGQYGELCTGIGFQIGGSEKPFQGSAC